MISREVEISFKIGIHGRPAALVVQKARDFGQTKITIGKNGRTVDAKSLTGLLSLGIVQGSTITVSAEGGKEEEALQSMINLITVEIPSEA